MPPIEEPENPFFAAALPLFSPKLYQNNLEQIHMLVASVNPEEVQDQEVLNRFEKNVQFMYEIVTRYESLFFGPHELLPIQKTLGQCLPELVVWDDRLEDYLSGVAGNAVMLSSSHASTYYELAAAKHIALDRSLLRAEDKLALIVFDEHIDFYAES